MMDKYWLKQIGVTSSDDELANLEEIIVAALEQKISRTLNEALTNRQIAEAARLVEKTGDIPLEWLEKAYPGYKEYVASETASLRRAISRSKNKTTYIQKLAPQPEAER